MLMQIGPVTFSVHPFNMHEYSRTSLSDFARKDVVGARRPLEYMGEGEETLQIMGKLLPKHLGGLQELAALQAMREQAEAQYVMRGDGHPLGWFIVEQVDERADNLSIDGVGQQVDFTIYLVRAPGPGVTGNFSFNSLFSLLDMMFG